MSFICQNHSTVESLKIWSGNNDILILKFYFWSGGTLLEKNINGLLRSLLWQILQNLPSLQVSSVELRSGSSLTALPIAAWTERRLRTMFTEIIRQVSETHRLCIFLDGLDEFDGDQDELVSWIRETLRSSEIKMCLSSRPYRAFDQAFGSSAKLRLQDLTRNDIREFVVNEFQDQEVLQMLSTAAEVPLWLERVKDRILDRAEGVFLWVDLAVKDQIRGLKNGDSLQQLEESLEILPDKIEDIYARMLSQIKKPHRKEASMFLQIALSPYNSSLFSHVLAMQPDLDGWLSSPASMLEDIVTSHETVEKRIMTTCAGLLEIIDKYEESEPCTGFPLEESRSKSNSEEIQRVSVGEDAASADKHLYANSGKEIFDGERILAGSGVLTFLLHSRVAFVHRTAVDFMTDREQGGIFLNDNTPTSFGPEAFHVKFLLAMLKIFVGRSEAEVQDDIKLIMSIISAVEYQTGVAQTNLCSLTDDIMRRIDRDRNGHEDSHWSARWGPAEFMQQKEGIIPSVSRKSSRSRFSGSVSSIDLRSEDHDISSMVLSREPSFVSLAASYGLFLYVRQVLEGRRTPLEISSANWLLYSSVLSLPIFVQHAMYPVEETVAGLQLINEMLRRGADPNCAINGVDSIWSSFLQKTHVLFYKDWTPIRDGDEAILARIKLEFARITVLFCENGADLKKNYAHTFENHSERFSFSFDVDMSILAFVEIHLNSQKKIFRIREMCFSSGISYYARCFTFRFEKAWDESIEEYDISEAESDAVIEIIREGHTTSRGRERMQEDLEKFGDKILRERSRPDRVIKTQ